MAGREAGQQEEGRCAGEGLGLPGVVSVAASVVGRGIG